jgi:type II secretory pathway component PulM
MSDFEVHPAGTRERIEQLEHELQRLRALLAERAGRRPHTGQAAARSGDAPSARDPFADW